MSTIAWTEERIFRHHYNQGFWETRQCLLPEFENRPDGVLPQGLQTIKHLQYLELANSLALIHTEVSEAIEGIRKNPDWRSSQSEHVPAMTNLEEELADIVIRVRDLCGGLNIHLEDCINQKMEYNLTRPHKHGKHA